jgi:GrpB-like predicted nucleotidyltransferase (UPF0157 family)
VHTIERVSERAAVSGSADETELRPIPVAAPVPATRNDTEAGLAPYHPSWPARFRVEAEVLRVALAPLSPVIEHVGSTAVPGLAALPVIDMTVGIAAPEAVDAYADRLANFGYRLMTASEYRAADRRVLLRMVRGVRTHHVHVVTAFGDAWHRLLMFRDMLRLDRDLGHAYASLKRELMRQTHGRPLLYAAGKADFICSVLGRPAIAAGAG